MILTKLHSFEGESSYNKKTTTEDDSGLDIKANGIWGGRFSRTFFDEQNSKIKRKKEPIILGLNKLY